MGKSSEVIPLPQTPWPLTELIALLTSKYQDQGLGAVLKTSRWSVENTLVEIEDLDEWSLSGGEELAVIPPVSGG